MIAVDNVSIGSCICLGLLYSILYRMHIINIEVDFLKLWSLITGQRKKTVIFLFFLLKDTSYEISNSSKKFDSRGSNFVYDVLKFCKILAKFVQKWDTGWDFWIFFSWVTTTPWGHLKWQKKKFGLHHAFRQDWQKLFLHFWDDPKLLQQTISIIS